MLVCSHSTEHIFLVLRYSAHSLHPYYFFQHPIGETYFEICGNILGKYIYNYQSKYYFGHVCLYGFLSMSAVSEKKLVKKAK